MDAKAFIAAISDAKLRSLAKSASAVFEKRGCDPYVKTIYLGYTYDNEMVAAIYPQAKTIEVALALPEDAPSSLLVGANHLTWPTMPVAAVLSSKADLDEFRELADESVQRIKGSTHDVKREAKFFENAGRGRKSSGITK